MNYQNFLNLLRKIIATNTISSDNLLEQQSNIELIELLKSEALKRGGICQEQQIIMQPRKNNLLIKFGEGDGGILFSGHTDTVACDPKLWINDPFKIVETENKIIGLGSIDMKGFFAHVFSALDDIDLKKLKKPIYILATVDEETTMIGAEQFVLNNSIKPDFCIIGEPTSLTPVFKHKGYIAYSIVVKGESSHSSNPKGGINAIEIVNDIIFEIKKMSKYLELNFKDENFSIDYPTINIGCIKGGDSINRVCSSCEIQFDVRPLPNTPCSKIDQILRQRIKDCTGINYERVSIKELYNPIEPFSSDISNKYISKLEQISNNNAVAVNYCTEASFLKKLGCPLVIFGCGSINNAHQPNEFIPKEEIPKMNKILLTMINEICG